jgi:hypothetical protein
MGAAVSQKLLSRSLGIRGARRIAPYSSRIHPANPHARVSKSISPHLRAGIASAHASIAKNIQSHHLRGMLRRNAFDLARGFVHIPHRC